MKYTKQPLMDLLRDNKFLVELNQVKFYPPINSDHQNYVAQRKREGTRQKDKGNK
jgi:hypothetical protein